MSTNLNGFSVNIKNDSVVHIHKNGHNYYSLPNMSEYKIKLTNSRSERCDAVVYIDGTYIGMWRIGPYSSIILERPAHLNRKFVFVEENSNIAMDSGIQKYNPENGLIKVIFKPERTLETPLFQTPLLTNQSGRTQWRDTNGYDTFFDAARSESSNAGLLNNSYRSNSSFSDTISYNSGATVLGNNTDQYFNTTNRLTAIDDHNTTTIHLRLIVAARSLRKEQHPYISINSIKNMSIPPRFRDNYI